MDPNNTQNQPVTPAAPQPVQMPSAPEIPSFQAMPEAPVAPQVAPEMPVAAAPVMPQAPQPQPFVAETPFAPPVQPVMPAEMPPYAPPVVAPPVGQAAKSKIPMSVLVLAGGGVVALILIIVIGVILVKGSSQSKVTNTPSKTVMQQEPIAPPVENTNAMDFSAPSTADKNTIPQPTISPDTSTTTVDKELQGIGVDNSASDFKTVDTDAQSL